MTQIDPEILAQNPTRVNEQQLQMLNTFKDPFPEEDFAEIRRLIVKLLAKWIDDEMERLEKLNGWTQETYEPWGHEHFRTPYKEGL